MKLEVIKDGKYEYIEAGEGPVMLVLHGLFGALSNFDNLIEHFSKTHRVIVPVMPVYTLPIIKTSVSSLKKYISAFVTYKKLKDIVLVGNSLGGHVALVYLTDHISNVKQLVLTGSSGLYENTMGGTFPRRKDFNFIRQKVALTFYDPKHATNELVDECYSILNERGKVIRVLSLAKSAIRHNMAEDLPKFNVPTCLIWGKNDTITPPQVGQEFQDLLPNADLYWIDECGHAPMMEHPEEFNKLLDIWFEKQKAKE